METRLDADADYIDYIIEHFGSDLTGLELVVDCANGACAGLAPEAFERLGATVHAIGNAPDGTNINARLRRHRHGTSPANGEGAGAALGVAFDGDGDRLMTDEGRVVDGDGIVAILRSTSASKFVAVTQMTNLGFHSLMAERGIRVAATDVGDRYVLEALEREGGVLGGEQSGHIIYLRDHVSGDGLAAALLLCAALEAATLGEAAAVLPRFIQVKENVRVSSKGPTDAVRTAVERANAELGDAGVLVRASGTEPIIRVLVEAQDAELGEEGMWVASLGLSKVRGRLICTR